MSAYKLVFFEISEKIAFIIGQRQAQAKSLGRACPCRLMLDGKVGQLAYARDLLAILFISFIKFNLKYFVSFMYTFNDTSFYINEHKII